MYRLRVSPGTGQRVRGGLPEHWAGLGFQILKQPRHISAWWAVALLSPAPPLTQRGQVQLGLAAPQTDRDERAPFSPSSEGGGQTQLRAPAQEALQHGGKRIGFASGNLHSDGIPE